MADATPAATIAVEREALEAIRDGFLVTKALLTCTPEELAAADRPAILRIVNGGYEVLKNLLWQAGDEDGSRCVLAGCDRTVEPGQSFYCTVHAVRYGRQGESDV